MYKFNRNEYIASSLFPIGPRTPASWEFADV